MFLKTYFEKKYSSIELLPRHQRVSEEAPNKSQKCENVLSIYKILKYKQHSINVFHTFVKCWKNSNVQSMCEKNL